MAKPIRDRRRQRRAKSRATDGRTRHGCAPIVTGDAGAGLRD